MTIQNFDLKNFYENNPGYDSKRKISNDRIDNLNDKKRNFNITTEPDGRLEFEAKESDYKNKDYTLDSPSLNEAVGFAFGLGFLDTVRGLGQIAGIKEDELKEQQKKLNAYMQGEHGALVTGAYFFGALLDPATWLIPFGKAKTLYQMGKYGMVSGGIAGAAGYVDEDSIIDDRGTQALVSALGGGIISPGIGAIKNLGVKVTGKGEKIPLGLIEKFDIKPQTVYKKKLDKVQLQGKANKIEDVGDKKIITAEKGQPAFARQPEDIPFEKTVIDKDLQNFQAPVRGRYLKGPQTFFRRYIENPYQRVIGNRLLAGLKTGEGAAGAIGGAYGFNMEEEAPLLSVDDPMSARFSRAFFGALTGYFGGKYLLKKKGIFGLKYQGQDETLENFLGRALIDKYGLPVDFVKARQNAQGMGNLIASQFKTVADKVRKLSMDERRILYNMLEGDNISPVNNATLLALKDEARSLISKTTQYYVDLGLLTQKKAQENIQTYLRRIYAKDDNLTRIGDELKARGILQKVTKADYEKNYKNVRAFDDNGNMIKNHKGWELFDEVADEDGYITIRWAYTKPERLAIQEIEDAALSIDLTGALMANTISQHRFYSDLASKPNLTIDLKSPKFKGKTEQQLNEMGYFKMPSNKIKETGVEKYGALAGKFVTKELHRNLISADNYRNQTSKGFWRGFIGLNRVWKASKTAWNPTVHFNNIMGNIVFTDMADVSYKNLLKSWRMLIKHGSDSSYKSETIYLAQKLGVFDADFVTRELRNFDLKAISKKYRYNENKSEWDNALGIARGVYDVILKKPVQGVTGKLETYYRLEDQVFRLNAFIDRLNKGVSPDEAAMFSRKYFIDYDIDAPVINWARNTVTPFLAFTYRVVPIIAETAVLRPWKFAKYAALGYGLNKMGEVYGGGDADKERQLMPKYKSGNILGLPFMPYKNIKLPFETKEGQQKYLFVERYFPGGDILDLGKGVVPGFPAPLQPSGGIYGDILFSFIGYDLFTKRADASRGLSLPEDLKAVTQSLSSKLIPNFPFLAGSYATERINRATKGDISPYRTKESELQAIANAFGIKISNVELEKLEITKKLEFDKKLKAVKKDIRELLIKYETNRITKAKYLKDYAKLAIKAEKITEEFGLRLRGINPNMIKIPESVLNLLGNGGEVDDTDKLN